MQRLELRGAGARAAVADPGLGVLARVLALALDDPVLEARRRRPAGDPLEPVADAVAGRRGTPSCRAAARCRPARGARPRPARPPRRARRRPCRRRGTRSSGTPGCRGVMTNGGFDTMRSKRSPATGSNRLPRRNSIAVDAVEGGVEPGVVEGARRDVGRDHAVAEPGRVHRLDAAARAEVERRADGPLQQQPAQGRRRPADAEHVLLGERTARSRARRGRTRSTTPPRPRRRGTRTGAGRRAAHGPRRRRGRPRRAQLLGARERRASAARRSRAADATGTPSTKSRTSVVSAGASVV